MPLLCVNEVRKLVRVADKEDWRIVAHEIPIAFLRIELQGETAHITLGIDGAGFSCHASYTRKHVRILPFASKYAGFGVTGDVVCYGACPEGAPALSVNRTLGNSFPVLVC